MTTKIKEIFGILKEAGNGFMEDNAQRLGAALAFYTMLSLSPFVILILSIAAFALGDEAARGHLDNQIQGIVGADAAKAIQDVVKESDKPAQGTLATLIGIVTLLIGASGVFGELQSAMDKIWRVKSRTGSGVINFLRSRFLSFTMILGIGFLLLVSLALSAGVAAFTNYVGAIFPATAVIVNGLNFILSFILTTVLFGLIYKALPNAHLSWRDVRTGALITAALFTVGKAAIGFYLGFSSVESTYGAAGSLVALLIWVYYSSQILFFGAEITKVITFKKRRKIPRGNGNGHFHNAIPGFTTTEQTYIRINF